MHRGSTLCSRQLPSVYISQCVFSAVPPPPGHNRALLVVAAPRLVPWPSHFITDASAEAVPSVLAEICMLFHPINSVYIQLIFAY